MIKTLLLNLTLIISYLFLHSIINKYLLCKIKNDISKKILNGLFYGVLGLVLMIYSIKVSDKIIVDLRHLAVILISLYGGITSGLTTAIFISLGRVAINGVSNASIVAALLMICIGIISGIINKGNISRLGRRREYK